LSMSSIFFYSLSEFFSFPNPFLCKSFYYYFILNKDNTPVGNIFVYTQCFKGWLPLFAPNIDVNRWRKKNLSNTYIHIIICILQTIRNKNVTKTRERAREKMRQLQSYFKELCSQDTLIHTHIQHTYR
jgi:hypothetical protein